MKKHFSRLLLFLLSAALLLSASVLAAEDSFTYVLDYAGILTDSEAEILESAAAEISAEYGCGVYIATLEDMADFGFSDIEECAEVFYSDMDLGLGSDHTGILLLMSMADRDYDLAAYGNDAHYAFTDYGKSALADQFLDNFRDGDWYGGYYDYLSECEHMLSRARDGDPVDVRGRGAQSLTTGELVLSVVASLVLGLLVAFLICTLLRSQMRSVRTAADADAYVPKGGVQFSHRSDQFVRTSERRVYDPPSNRSGGSGGGTTVRSSGFSHSSGKF